jgi:hypothetical protein
MYTDPGIGSLLIQVLLGIILGIPVIIGLFWSRIKSFWSKLRKHE